MKWILILYLMLSFSIVNAQENCRLLKSIINAIDLQRSYIEAGKSLYNKVDILSDTRTGKSSVIKRNGFENDKELDSLIHLSNIKAIVGAADDTLFHLSDFNVIVDTFKFFTPNCNCILGGKKFMVVNAGKDVPNNGRYNVIKVYYIGKHRGRPCIYLQHSSAKPYQIVAFYYTVKRSRSIVQSIIALDTRE